MASKSSVVAINPHADVAGRILVEGDRIATTFHGATDELVLGTVLGLTPAKIRIQIDKVDGKGRPIVITKFGKQLACVTGGTL